MEKKEYSDEEHKTCGYTQTLFFFVDYTIQVVLDDVGVVYCSNFTR